MLAVALASAAPAAGCSGDGAIELAVDVQTDLRPGLHFAGVRVEAMPPMGDARTESSLATTGDDYLAGERVAELADLPKGGYRVDVSLRDTDGEIVASRRIAVRLEGDRLLHVVITSSCLGTRCPADGDDPDATECLAGRCVPPECIEAGDEECGPAECMEGSECTGLASCADPSCSADGVCLGEPDDSRCATGALCDVREGCRAPGMFGPEVEVGGLTGEVSEPTLTDDGTELVFQRSGDLYTATGSIEDGFAEATPIDALNTSQLEGGPQLGTDGLSLVFARGVIEGTGDLDLYISRRSALGEPWGAPAEIDRISRGTVESSADITDDGTLIVFSSNRGSGTLALFQAERPSPSQPWGDASRIAELSTSSHDGNPCLSSDGLRLVFSTGPLTRDRDIYVSERSSRGDPWGPARLFEGIDNSGNESAAWLSEDGRTLCFSRSERLFCATREP